MDFSLNVIVIAVVGIVGGIQWLKGFFHEDTATWPWRVLMALLCVAWGIVIGPSWVHRALYALFLVAVCEASYKVVVQKLGEFGGSLLDKLR